MNKIINISVCEHIRYDFPSSVRTFCMKKYPLEHAFLVIAPAQLLPRIDMLEARIFSVFFLPFRTLHKERISILLRLFSLVAASSLCLWLFFGPGQNGRNM
jgi:hypothetical protein